MYMGRKYQCTVSTAQMMKFHPHAYGIKNMYVICFPVHNSMVCTIDYSCFVEEKIIHIRVCTQHSKG